MKVYALNLFNVSDKEEYLAYSRRSAREAAAGDINPRQVMILVEWDSKAAFESYCNDPKLADLHPHRHNGASDYIWHLFDRLDDLRPLLK